MKPPDRSPGRAGSQFVLAGRWLNHTIGPSRLVASFRSAYEIRTVGNAVPGVPPPKAAKRSPVYWDEQFIWKIPRFFGIGGFLRPVAADNSFWQAGGQMTPLGPLDWSLVSAREVLLEWLQAQPISHEFGSGHCPAGDEVTENRSKTGYPIDKETKGAITMSLRSPKGCGNLHRRGWMC